MNILIQISLGAGGTYSRVYSQCGTAELQGTAPSSKQCQTTPQRGHTSLYSFLQCKRVLMFSILFFGGVPIASLGLSLVTMRRGLLFIAVSGLLISVASLVTKHWLHAHSLQ